jgi:hypothetical protein
MKLQIEMGFRLGDKEYQTGVIENPGRGLIMHVTRHGLGNVIQDVKNVVAVKSVEKKPEPVKVEEPKKQEEPKKLQKRGRKKAKK